MPARSRALRPPAAANGELVHHETTRSSALSHFCFFGSGKLKNHVSVSLTSGALHVSLARMLVIVVVAD